MASSSGRRVRGCICVRMQRRYMEQRSSMEPQRGNEKNKQLLPVPPAKTPPTQHPMSSAHSHTQTHTHTHKPERLRVINQLFRLQTCLPSEGSLSYHACAIRASHRLRCCDDCIGQLLRLPHSMYICFFPQFVLSQQQQDVVTSTITRSNDRFENNFCIHRHGINLHLLQLNTKYFLKNRNQS